MASKTVLQEMGAKIKGRWAPHHHGNCKILSEGKDCDCVLCLVDFLVNTACSAEYYRECHYADERHLLEFIHWCEEEFGYRNNEQIGKDGWGSKSVGVAKKAFKEWRERERVNQRDQAI